MKNSLHSWTSPHRVPLGGVCVMVLALVLPSLVTWVYFVLLANFPPAVQQAAWVGTKALQFALPVVWVFAICGRRPEKGEWSWEGLGWGIGFGLLVAAHGILIYFGWLRTSELFASVSQQVQMKVVQLGIEEPRKFLAVGVFYALVHSGLEEYYWRWFVFGELRRYSDSFHTAAVASSLGFAAHHVILLGVYFGFQHPGTWLFAAAVALGGYVWALIYHRCGNLSGPWASHLLVDAFLFGIGFDMAFTVVR